MKQDYRDGKLALQCTGSVHFLRLSLDEIFGKGSAGFIAGAPISLTGRITRLGHAQTGFQHNGRFFILDSSAREAGSNMPMMQKSRTAQPPRVNTLDRTEYKPAATSASKKPDQEPSYTLTTIRNSLEMQSAMLFRMPQATGETILERVSTLRRSDPIRETFKTVLRLGNGRATSQELDQLSNLLGSYHEIAYELRKEFGIPVYEQPVLTALQETFSRIRQYAIAAGVLEPDSQ
jgi:hypothetical protein